MHLGVMGGPIVRVTYGMKNQREYLDKIVNIFVNASTPNNLENVIPYFLNTVRFTFKNEDYRDEQEIRLIYEHNRISNYVLPITTFNNKEVAMLKINTKDVFLGQNYSCNPDCDLQKKIRIINTHIGSENNKIHLWYN